MSNSHCIFYQYNNLLDSNVIVVSFDQSYHARPRRINLVKLCPMPSKQLGIFLLHQHPASDKQFSYQRTFD